MSEITLTIEKIIPGGDGLAFYRDKAVFIPGVLPSEVVEGVITEEKKGFYRAELTKVVTPAPQRTEPFCPHFDICGGCSLQYMSYEKQLEIKKEMVRDSFLRTGKISLGDFDIVPSPQKGYRNRVQFHSDGHSLGFKKKKSDRIISLDSCPLLAPGLNSYLKEKKSLPEGRYLVFSHDGEYREGLKGSEDTLTLLNKEVHYSPGGFFQSNLTILPRLISWVKEQCDGEHIMDLYSGIGLFSLFLKDQVKQITAVEINRDVKPFIEKNLKGSQYSFYPMSLEDYVKKGMSRKNRADTVIVDPPRTGLSSRVRQYLIKMGVKKIIYVSCNPVTMARDVKDLTEGGYILKEFKLFDFYPQTPHMEAAGVLTLE